MYTRCSKLFGLRGYDSRKTLSFFRNLFTAFLIWLIGGWPTLVFALPKGEQVVSGDATFTRPDDSTFNVNQTSEQLIATFDSFNIGQTESVNVAQPSSDAMALFRVLGTDPSLIEGNLTANGQVFISNGSGVFFSGGSKVDTYGLVATTMNISNQDFLDGNYNFTQNGPLASVINEGTISATSYVGLLAPAVENRGTIVASLGSVDLAAGKAATLDFTGDGLINFEVTEAVSGTVTDKDGNVLENRVSNTGLIQADGGLVRMTAQDAGDVIRNVVNMTGVIEANTVVEKEGRIFLSGGDKGIVKVSGTLSASGDDIGEQGGVVHVLGEKVGLFDNAVIDVSGDTGGGTALIGGDFQGKNEDIQNAFRTYVGEGVEINANAITSGDGGKVIIWSDETTVFYGDIIARGGALSGDGGFVEVSGKQNLGFYGWVDLTAPNGVLGNLLLDPADLTIGTTTTDDGQITGDQTLLSGDSCAGNPCFISASQIVTQLDTANVSLATTNSITVDSAIDASGNTNSNSLTLTANGGAGTITLNANITTKDAGLTLDGVVAIGEGLNISISTGSGAGDISVSGALDGTTFGSAESLTVNAGTGQVDLAAVGSGDTTGLTAVTITDSGAMNFNGVINITGALTQTNAATGATDFANTVSLGSATLAGTSYIVRNTFATTGATSITNSGNISCSFACDITANGGFNSSGTVAFGGAAVGIATVGTDLTIGGNLSVSNSRTLTTGSGSAGNVLVSGFIAGNGVGADTLIIEAGTGSVTLNNINGVSPDGMTNLTISSSGSVDFNGVVTLPGTLSVTSTGNITGTAGAFTITGTTSLTTNISGAGTITVTNSSNDFTGAITLSSGSGAVQLVDSTDTILAASTLGGNLTVTSTGNITQTGALSVGAASSFTSTGGSITLNNGSNDLGTILSLDTNNSFDVVTTTTSLTSLTLTVDASNSSTYSLSASNISTFDMTDSVSNIVLGASGAGLTVSSGAIDFALNLDTGSVDVNGNITTNGGSFTVGGVTGAALFDSGTIVIDNTFSATTTTITGGTATFNGTANTNQLTITGGTLNGTGNVTVVGDGTSAIDFTWTGAATSTISGVASSGDFLTTGTSVDTNTTTGVTTSIDTDSDGATFSGSSWTNNGTITYTLTSGASSLTFDNAPTFSNAGNFNITTASGANIEISGTVGIFNNSGTLNYSASGSTTDRMDINATFNNTGTVNVTAGLLQIGTATGTGTDTGTYDVASGGLLEFQNATKTLSGTTFNGDGTARVTSGTLSGTLASTNTGDLGVTGGTLTINSTSSINKLLVSSGTLDGTGNITVTGDGTTATDFTWSGGTISGVASSGVFLQTGASVDTNTTTGVTSSLDTSSSVLSLLGSSWTNNGTLTWTLSSTDLNLQLNNASIFNNAGTFNIIGNDGVANIEFVSGGVGTINNSGTLNYSADSLVLDRVDIFVNFNNSGTVNVNSGRLQVGIASGSSADTGNYVVASGAEVEFQNATRTFSSTSTFTGAGIFNFSSGAYTFNSVTMNNTGTVNFAGTSFTTSNSNLSITAADIDISVALDVGTGDLTIIRSGGGTIGLGATAGDMTITGAELDLITAANVNIGDGTVGDITVNGISLANTATISDTLTLTSGGTIAFNTGATAITNKLAVSAVGDITQSAGLSVGSTSSFTVTGSNVITLTNSSNDFTGGITLVSASGATQLTDSTISLITSATSTSGNLTLTSTDLTITTINVGSGDVTLIRSGGGTIGLGATAGGMTIDGSELQNITATNLIIGDSTSGNITVNGISAANSNNISNTVTLNATVSGGTVTFASGASTFNTLTVNAENGIEMDISLTTDTGAMTFDADSDNDGTGSVNFDSGGTIVINGNYTANNTNLSSGTATFNDTTNTDQLTITGGTLNGTGNVTVVGDGTSATDFTWSGGTIDVAGTLTTNSATTTDMNGSSEKSLNETWDNFGTINWTAGDGDFKFDGGTLNNKVGGTFDWQNSNPLANITNSGGQIQTFNNEGTFIYSSSGTSAVIEETFNNTGTVQVTGGSLKIASAGTDTGTYAVSSGSTLEFGPSGTRTFTNVSITGSGTVSFTFNLGTITTGNTDLSITAADLNIATGINAGSGTVTILGSGSVGLGGATGTMSLSLSELQKITAQNLIIGATGDLNVDGVTGLSSIFALSSTNDIFFQSNASDFNGALTVLANNDINVQANITAGGDFIAVADNDKNDAGDFTSDSGTTITSTTGDIHITAVKININGSLVTPEGDDFLKPTFVEAFIAPDDIFDPSSLPDNNSPADSPGPKC